MNPYETFRVHHPALMAIIPFFIACFAVAFIILWRWLSNRNAWRHHPGGANGFLHDEFLRLGAIFIPYAIVMLGVRYYVYDVHPELLKSPLFYVGLLSVFVFRRLSRFIPFVRAAARRVDAARAAQRASNPWSS
jgi:hypothetical protein